jgi:CRP-like cAMP-binding protein
MQERLRISPGSFRKANARFNGLLTNKILSGLPGATFAQLLPYLEPTSFQTGKYIYEQGQNVSFVYFPESVVISQLYYLEDGSSAEVSIIGSDGLLGLTAILDGSLTKYWAIATIGGSALRIGVEDLKRFAASGPLQKLILRYAHERMVQLAQKAVCNTRHRLEERLGSWLLMIHDRAQGSDLPLTHEAISQHLGIRRAGVTKFCSTLRDNKVIDYQRGIIKVLDRDRLKESTCECYQRMADISNSHRDTLSQSREL